MPRLRVLAAVVVLSTDHTHATGRAHGWRCIASTPSSFLYSHLDPHHPRPSHDVIRGRITCDSNGQQQLYAQHHSQGSFFCQCRPWSLCTVMRGGGSVGGRIGAWFARRGGDWDGDLGGDTGRGRDESDGSAAGYGRFAHQQEQQSHEQQEKDPSSTHEAAAAAQPQQQSAGSSDASEGEGSGGGGLEQELIEAETRDILSVYASEDRGECDAEDDDDEDIREVPHWRGMYDSEEGAEEGGDDEGGGSSGGISGGGMGGRTTEKGERRVCILIDPFTPYLGRYVKATAEERGLTVVEAMSPYVACSMGKKAMNWRAPRPGQEGPWLDLLPCPRDRVEFVLSESDVGVATAERLQVACGARGNGVSPVRRNKYLMNEALKKAGAASAQQVLARRWEDVVRFLDTLTTSAHTDAHPKVLAVVKPVRGAGSEDVYLCGDRQDVQKAFEAILDTPKYGGGLNEGVLVQEFLRGQEYAVDTVSRDGVHKVVAVWRYDKREANGAPFVYFATELRPAPEGSVERQVCDYVTNKVLSALKVRWGPAHTEVILTEDRGPVLVEFNGRWHLCNFAPLVDACLGVNALDATLDAFVDEDRFDALPAVPEQLRAAGRVVHLVCFEHGEVRGYRHLEEIEALPSVQALEIFPSFEIGKVVKPTTDIKTDAGYALLVHPDPGEVERDYQEIQTRLQRTMFDIAAPSGDGGEA